MKGVFMPKVIKVGYNERRNTYTGKLAFVTYYDAKGILRKETSWDGWRDKKIEASEFDNIPTEGFVLNKKAGGGGSGWNNRDTYCRVYDPRGFEMEIGIDNLLYILDNTSSIKGKGLEGEFVYCWSGKDMMLVPCSSTDYKEINDYSEKVNENKNFKAKDLVVGNKYLFKKGFEAYYVGKFRRHKGWKKEVYGHYFCEEREQYVKNITTKMLHKCYTLQSIVSEIEGNIDDLIGYDFDEIIKLQSDSYDRISFREPKKDKMIPVSSDEINKIFNDNSGLHVRIMMNAKINGEIKRVEIEQRYEKGFYNEVTLTRTIEVSSDRWIPYYSRKKHRYGVDGVHNMELFVLETFDKNNKFIEDFGEIITYEDGSWSEHKEQTWREYKNGITK